MFFIEFIADFMRFRAILLNILRSFSAHKNLLADNRRSFKLHNNKEALSDYSVIQIKHFYSFFYYKL